jgi:MFS family permease
MTANERRQLRPSLMIGVLSCAGMTVSLMQTVLLPLIPDLPRLLNVSTDEASWLITATLLSSAVATPSVTRLADMYGKRRMMIISLLGMLAGSILGAVGQSLLLLILARALQGFAMALVPIGMSIMRDELPREKLSYSVALMSATLGIGAAVGLPLSGIIFAHFGWHAIFWVSAILASIMLVGILLVVPESNVRTGGNFDLFGAVLLSAILISFLLGVTKGGQWGWLSQSTLIAFALAAILFAFWLPWEFRITNPLVDLHTSMGRPVLLTNFASFLIAFSMFCNMLTTTEVLQMPPTTGYGFGLSTIQAGLAMLPAGIAMIVMAPVSAGITRRFGPRTTLMVGAAILASGYLERIFFMNSVGEVVFGAIFVSCGTAIAYAPMPILIMRSVPITETSAANGLNNVLRSIGTSTASAVVAAIFTSSSMKLAGAFVPAQEAFTYIYGSAVIAAVLGGLVAFTIPKSTNAS